ncbi:hypothetical protein HUK76_03320 [Citrobacter portucalensis]|uniref:hypothetical protein n=1 Tax=Citrobacter portucalensis TaxID=1639133 RepID=UPI001580ACB9|nr:hypothetical protein [Citrobacter portucalensis]NUH52738.1 hypothetical protein [Citrobacter portucalensis]
MKKKGLQISKLGAVVNGQYYIFPESYYSETGVMDIESIRIAEESARWGFWSMIAAAVSAIATVATALIALLASRAWRKQERLNQLIRLKRAAFEYRALLETISAESIEGILLEDFIQKRLTPARANIFHELALAGLEDENTEQGMLFDKLFRFHDHYKYGEVGWGVLLAVAITFQKSIKVKI